MNEKEESYMQIVIVGDMPSSRKAISFFVKAHLGIEVAGETGNVDELMKLVDAATPDLILIDGDLPNVEINELVPSLRGLHFSPSVIVLNNQPEMEFAAIEAGAEAFITKTSPPKQLLIAIKKVGFERGQH